MARAGWTGVDAAVLVAAVIAVFGPTLGYPPVWDDLPLLAENPALAHPGAMSASWPWTTTLGGHWQPLTWITLALELRVAGRFEPAVTRAGNIALHAIAAVCVYGLARRLNGPDAARARWAALAGAIAFALHPLRVESVVWLVERRDVLSGALLLGAVHAWLAARSPGPRSGAWRALALALHAASLLAKAWGASLPVVLVVLECLERRHRPAPGAWRRIVPHVGVVLPVLVVAPWAQHRGGALADLDGLSLAGRLGLATRGVWYYPAATLAPVGLSPLHERPPGPGAFGWVELGLAVAAGLALAALIRLARRWPGPLAAALCYAALIAPVLGLLQSGPQAVADRYAYLAGIPMALLVARGLAAVERSGRRPLVAAVAVGLGLALSALTLRHSRHWRDELALWTRAAAVQPDGILIQGNLGLAHLQRARACRAAGQLDAAEHHRQRAAQHLARSRELAGH